MKNKCSSWYFHYNSFDNQSYQTESGGEMSMHIWKASEEKANGSRQRVLEVVGSSRILSWSRWEKKEQKNWMTTCKTQMAGERKRRSVMLVAPPVSLFLWHNHLVTLACRPRENDKDSETKVDVFTYTRKNGFISQADGLFFPSSGHVKRTRRWVKRDWRGEQRAKWQQGADDEWVIRDREERRRWNQSGTVVIATAASALLPLCATSYFLLLLLLLPPVPSS